MHYVCCCKVKNFRSLVKYEDCVRTNEWIHDSCEHSVPALPKKSCHGEHSPAAANSAHPKCDRYLTAHWALKSNTPRGWWCFHCRLTSRLVGEPYQKTKSRRLTFPLHASGLNISSIQQSSKQANKQTDMETGELIASVAPRWSAVVSPLLEQDDSWGGLAS